MTIGWDNFTRVFHDEGIQKPFFAIFVWTVVFSVLTVVLTVAVGMILACRFCRMPYRHLFRF